jgi:hypothetical protein
MNPLFYVVVGIGVLTAIVILWLLVDWAMRTYSDWREQQDMRVRNSRLNKYNIAAFRGTKQRNL